MPDINRTVEGFFRAMFGRPQSGKHRFRPESGYPGANPNLCDIPDGVGGDPTHLCGKFHDDPVHLLSESSAMPDPLAGLDIQWSRIPDSLQPLVRRIEQDALKRIHEAELRGAERLAEMLSQLSPSWEFIVARGQIGAALARMKEERDA